MPKVRRSDVPRTLVARVEERVRDREVEHAGGYSRYGPRRISPTRFAPDRSTALRAASGSTPLSAATFWQSRSATEPIRNGILHRPYDEHSFSPENIQANFAEEIVAHRETFT